MVAKLPPLEVHPGVPGLISLARAEKPGGEDF
jgi:hypothetical protein